MVLQFLPTIRFWGLTLITYFLIVYLMLYLLGNSITFIRMVMIFAFYRDYFPKPKILPDTHVQSVRVRSIFQDIVRVVLDKRKESGDFHGKDLKHLDGLNWEVLVMDAPYHHVLGYAHGKIVIHHKYLELFNTDVEIATTIAHEVGHLVAAHQYGMSIFFESARKMVYKIPVPYCFKKVKDDILFYQRQCEYEADHIGMMLMATAGYDPQATPAVYEKVGQICNNIDDFLQLHPQGNKRARYLRQFMEEAITIYSSSNKFPDGK